MRALSFLLWAAVGLGACEGCRTNGKPIAPAATDPGPPTARLYIVSNLAGALEPCGCTKDQLGGMDHLGAFVAAERGKAPNSALVAAGPLFFMEPQLRADRAEQDKAKADTIARALAGMGFVAFAPSVNDWAGGPDALATYVKDSGGVMLVANEAAPGAQKVVVRDVGGVKIAFIGVGKGAPPPAPVAPPAEAVKQGIAAAKQQGANVFVALASVGRGEAKRIADLVPELTAIVVGAATATGEGNSPAPPAEQIEKVIVAESANHLQSVAVLDLFVRDGSYAFADATGLARSQKREELTRRIDDLRVKIANWERDAKIAKADLDARRADLERLQKERDALDVLPPPEKGSFFRYTVKEIRDALGADPAARREMLAYYKSVNEKNRELFKDRAPLPAEPGTATYVGIEVCSSCHETQRKFWNGTAHSRAYHTLQAGFKEYNLDCVGCHVTGYEKPGGSTVTYVEKLHDVQCEVCHGPGSKHADKPNEPNLVMKTPRLDVCTSCHLPPHVEQFDAAVKMAEIVGPGHGYPIDAGKK